MQPHQALGDFTLFACANVVVRTRMRALPVAQKILVQEFMGDVYAVSNKCSHLGLPLQAPGPCSLTASSVLFGTA